MLNCDCGHNKQIEVETWIESRDAKFHIWKSCDCGHNFGQLKIIQSCDHSHN